MKKILLVLTLGISAFSSRAQFQYPIISEKARYFTDADEIYMLKTPIKIRFNGLDVYSVDRQPLSGCSKDSLSWISHMPDTTNNGNIDSRISIFENYRVNINGLIFAAALSPKGDKTLARVFSDGNEVWSEVKDLKWESFLGLADSVKTITFFLKNPSTKPEQRVYDSLYFKIAKRYGLIETRLLEMDQNNGLLYPMPGKDGKKISLIGSVRENIGWKPLSDSLIYNFEVGDEFHYKQTIDGTIFYPYCTSQTYSSNKVIAKDILNDSVVYTFDRRSEYETFNCSPGKSFKRDTLKIKYYNSNNPIEINKLHKYTDQSTPNHGYIFYCKNSTKDSIIYSQENTCKQYALSGSYAKGLGIIHEQKPLANGNDYKRDLVYYKKGSKTWGTKLILGVKEEQQYNADFIQLSPNPAPGNLTIITNQNGLSLQLFDASGKERLSVNTLSEGANNINISNLEAGFYIYRVNSGTKQLKTGKLIVQ